MRVASAQAACRIAEARVVMTPIGPRVYGKVECPDGWAAARYLLASSLSDAATPSARDLALQLRAEAGPDDLAYIRRVFDFVKQSVRFVREQGEVFARADVTLNAGAGDCDDHARVVYALLRAGGVPAALAFLYKPGEQGPRHVVALARHDGKWVWLETTIDAGLGEHPYAAATRLGLLNARADIAKEVRIMTEKDLAPLPVAFLQRTTPEQFERDVVALEKLGYLSACSAASNVADPAFRRAVADFQRASGGALKVDGLIGPKTRQGIGRALPPDEFGMGYIAELQPAPRGPTRIFTHAEARQILARAYRDEFGAEPSAGELDFAAAVAFFESGYGRAGAADWAQLGQFASWASEGLYNWGALQSSKPGPDKRQGKDAGRNVYFYVYPSDYEAARAMLRSLGGGARRDWLEAAKTGDARAVAAAMKRHGYYEGFHVGPGELGTNGRTAERGFKEEESKAIAEAKNIDDYAGALARFRATVTGPGGVPDPSPLPQGAPGTGSLLAIGFALIGVGLAYYWSQS